MRAAASIDPRLAHAGAAAAVAGRRLEPDGEEGQLLRRLSLRVTDAGDPSGVRSKLARQALHDRVVGRVSAVLAVAGKQVDATATKTGYAKTTARVRL